MASWSNPVIHAVGEDLATTDWNAVANNTTFLYQVPYILAYASSTQSTANNTTSSINLNTFVASGYGFTISSNNVVVPLTGVYTIGGTVTLTQNAATTTIAVAGVKQNGTGILSGATIPFNDTTNNVSPVAGLAYCTAGDTLSLTVYQDAGGPVATVAGAANCYLHVSFVGSQ